MNRFRSFITNFASKIPNAPGGGGGANISSLPVTILLLGGGLSYGAYHSVVTVQPGHQGIIYNRLSGIDEKARLREGMNFVIPWFQRAIVFDV
eukprot:gene17824-24889_t